MTSDRKSLKSKKELYLEQYQASKKKGETFFPYTLARDAIVGLVIVIVIMVLAIWVPAKLEPTADPTSTTYNPRPEWYFLFFFQFLKLFPGSLEALAAVVLPFLALAVLILIPLLDRSWERHYAKRKSFVAAGIFVVIILAILEIGGALTAPAHPAGEESATVQVGREVYRQVNCSYCHSINGVGGNIGPDLGNVGRDLKQEQIIAYLQNPHAMVPKTLHPKLLFTSEELQALTGYLSTLGAPVNYSADAPALYTRYCAGCHALNGKGGNIGPDLTGVGSRRPLSFLAAFTREPASVLPGSTMPAFKDSLNAEQINDISAYLFSQKQEIQAPAPSATPALTSTPAPAPTPAPTTQAPTKPAPTTSTPTQPAPTTKPTVNAPRIPHELEGRQNCLLCHGPGGIESFPRDHAGRTNDICQGCHSPSR